MYTGYSEYNNYSIFLKNKSWNNSKTFKYYKLKKKHKKTLHLLINCLCMLLIFSHLKINKLSYSQSQKNN